MGPPNLLLLLLLPMFVSTINAQTFFPVPYCGATGNFTANSTNQTTLLSSISTTHSLSLTYGFFNATSTVSDNSQNLYVIGSCHGDRTGESCCACLNPSVSKTRHLCSLQKEAVLYRENCTVRYSNASIFGTVATDLIYKLYNVNNVSSQVTYMLGTQMGGLQGEAASGGSLRKYTTRIVSVGLDMTFAKEIVLVKTLQDNIENCSRNALST